MKKLIILCALLFLSTPSIASESEDTLKLRGKRVSTAEFAKVFFSKALTPEKRLKLFGVVIKDKQTDAFCAHPSFYGGLGTLTEKERSLLVVNLPSKEQANVKKHKDFDVMWLLTLSKYHINKSNNFLDEINPDDELTEEEIAGINLVFKILGITGKFKIVQDEDEFKEIDERKERTKPRKPSKSKEGKSRNESDSEDLDDEKDSSAKPSLVEDLLTVDGSKAAKTVFEKILEESILVKKEKERRDAIATAIHNFLFNGTGTYLSNLEDRKTYLKDVALGKREIPDGFTEYTREEIIAVLLKQPFLSSKSE